MPRLLVIVAALLLSANAWAAELDKSSSLAVDKDATTGAWTATCDISVGGVDPAQTYSGRMLLWVNSAILYDAWFQVNSANRTWTASSPGAYTVVARLKGRGVSVQGDVPLGSNPQGFDVGCDTRIDPGTQPPPTGSTLFEAHMGTHVNAEPTVTP